MSNILLLMFTALIADNIVFSRGIGSDSADVASESSASAIKHGVILTVVMTVSALTAALLREFVIEPYSLGYMKCLFYVIILVLFSGVVTYSAGNIFAAIGKDRNAYGGSIITNFAALGVLFVLDSMGADRVTSVFYALFSGVGFTLASLIFAGIKERLAFSNVPKCMRGLPIMLVSAGIIALILAELSALLL